MDQQGQCSELRARIARLGMTQSGLARRMKQLGDPREEKNILRSIQRQISGNARFSGEMRALIGLLEEIRGLPFRGPSEFDTTDLAHDATQPRSAEQ
jgi:hypothetical protein